MAVLTKCPQCGTVFRVSAEQLRAAGGWVRCGRCATEFNAIAKLTDSREDRAAAINLESAPSPAAQLKDLVVTSERPSAHHNRHFRDQGWRSALWGVGALFLAGLLLNQYLNNEQATLASDPKLRPWIVNYCAISGCSIDEFRDLDALELRKRDLRMDPKRNGVLVINAILVNRAAIKQAFPTIELQLKDKNDRIVASRRFHSRDYIGPSVQAEDSMTPETPYHIFLETLITNEHAANFGFRFM